MTTEVLPVQPPASGTDPLRLLPIAASLLPAEVVAERRSRRAQRLVVWALTVLALSIGLGYAGAKYQTWMAQDELYAAEDDAIRLTQQQKQYDDVVRTQSESQAIKRQLETLMARDARWSTLLSSLRDAAPTGVALDSVSAKLTDETTPADSGQPTLSSTSADEIVATIDIIGTAGSKPQVAAYVDRLAKTTHLADPYLTSVTAEEKAGFRFNVRVSVTDTALGGRFAPEKTTGGN
jgi:Tfp pilus assembly protein PilN